jgi:hypothetical protein
MTLVLALLAQPAIEIASRKTAPSQPSMSNQTASLRLY